MGSPADQRSQVVTMSEKEESKKASEEESSSLFEKVIPRVKAEDEEEEEEEDEDEEDLIDPAVEIKEACASSEACAKYKTRLDECDDGNMFGRNPRLLPLHGSLCGAQNFRETQVD